MRIYLILLGLLLAQQASAEEPKETKIFPGRSKTESLCFPKCERLAKENDAYGDFQKSIYEINCDSKDKTCTCMCNMTIQYGPVDVDISQICQDTCKAAPGYWWWSREYSIKNEDDQLLPMCTCEHYVEGGQKSATKGQQKEVVGKALPGKRWNASGK